MAESAGPLISAMKSTQSPVETCLQWLGAVVVAALDLGPPRFQVSTKHLWWVLAMLQSNISLFLKL